MSIAALRMAPPLVLALSFPAAAQDMPGMTMPPQKPAPEKPASGNGSPAAAGGMEGPATGGGMEGMSVDSMDGMQGMQMDGMKMGDMTMPMMAGAAGPYAMMRDASGTAWQPDSTPMQGWMSQIDGWKTMLHGTIDGIYDHQGGKRGADKTFSESMAMAMAQRPLGPGTLTLRAMLSLDPLMGKSGYPLLLQTGETANGVAPLIDRQHPHDLFMELAGIYSLPVGETASLFAYLGYPGEPALGPPTFMHRASGMDDPAAPITHHWLDSTHITYGVVTGGIVAGDLKFEASAFHGREPDQFRWDFDSFTLDSASARLSWNPGPDWALQISTGFLKSPEQLEPGVDQHRLTASASYNRPFDGGNWQTTFALGRNDNNPGHQLDAVLLESAVTWDRNTVFARAENAAKDELVSSGPLAGRVFSVSDLSLGYVRDFAVANHLALGLGAMATLSIVPAALKPAYGSGPLSTMLFTRLKIE